MAREAFIDWTPRARDAERVQQCVEIVNEYRRQGLVLTLRQLYYQFVARALIANTERSYKNLGNLVSKARMAGYLDWSAIEDRGRQPDRPSEWSGLVDLVDAAVRAYRLPRWHGQATYAELWVEKAALAGVLEPLARKWHVTLMVNKGYSSQSAMYASAKRFAYAGQTFDSLKLFYLGDHDPSGEDMVRDVRERICLFSGERVHVEKLALTMAQIEEYDPPPNPAKMTDSRAKDYVREHGEYSWEVDALEPATLQRIINEAFERIVDQELMDEIIAREDADKEALKNAAKRLSNRK